MIRKQNREAALNILPLQKQDKQWDAVQIPKVSVADLNDQTFAHFRKCAVTSKRFPKEEVAVSNSALLKKLRLMEGRYLKRAALWCFHPEPEKFVPGAYIKIDYMGNDGSSLYQDTIHGNLFEQVDRTIDLISAKYTKTLISNEDASSSFPIRAIREALLNAVTHKDYSCGNPIQISVYDDRISVWNEGQLPASWTIQRLFGIHPSLSNNPDIANTLFRA
jgi:ATP-dependent DNA helicase RecG